eukprot:SAG31_NODE_1573_length_7850_cov_1.757193_8_plen_80_part_00
MRNTVRPCVTYLIISALILLDLEGKIHTSEAAELAVQGVALLGLVVTLWVLAPGIWFVGLATIIIVTTFNGITEEHEVC